MYPAAPDIALKARRRGGEDKSRPENVQNVKISGCE